MMVLRTLWANLALVGLCGLCGCAAATLSDPGKSPSGDGSVFDGNEADAGTDGGPTGDAAIVDLARQARLGAVRAAIRDSLLAFERDLSAPDHDVTIRDFAWAAHAKLILDGPVSEAEAFVRRAFAYQNMDSSSPQYGSFPWLEDGLRDDNSTPFTMQGLVPVLVGRGDVLSEAFTAEIRPHVAAALVALEVRATDICPEYTNVCVMASTSLAMLGEWLGDTRAASAGYAAFERWMAYTRTSGINEYASPSYYPVDLTALRALNLYAGRPSARSAAASIMDFFWTDMAASFFPGRQRLAGPHSRGDNYEAYAWGLGSIDTLFYVEGLRASLYAGPEDLRSEPYLEEVSLIDQPDKAHRPSAGLLAIANTFPRTLTGRWAADPGADRTLHVTADYAVGSTGADYFTRTVPKDRQLSVDLSSSTEELPGIVLNSVVAGPDGASAIYERGEHMRTRPTTVQSQNVVLALFNLDAAREAETSRIATHILFPAKAMAMVDGQVYTTNSASTRTIVPAAGGAVLGVFGGTGCAAFRIFAAEGVGGAATHTLVADSEGLERGLARYTITHYAGTEVKINQGIRIGLLVLAGRCENRATLETLMTSARTATIMENLAGNTWSASVQVAGTPLLEGKQDLATGAPLLRRIGGANFSPGVLTINGQNMTSLIPTSL